MWVLLENPGVNTFWEMFGPNVLSVQSLRLQPRNHVRHLV